MREQEGADVVIQLAAAVNLARGTVAARLTLAGSGGNLRLFFRG